MLESSASSVDTRALASGPPGSQQRELAAKPYLRERAHSIARPLGLGLRWGDDATGAGSHERDVSRSLSSLIDAVNYALAGCHERAQHSARIAIEALDEEIGAKTPLVPVAAESAVTKQSRAGLAPWQVRRVATYMDAHLAESIRCEDLARVARLSVSHFMRAFRDSFGAPPHAYLMRRRMEIAQRLMLTTDTALRQIALDCGFADQSHLTRLFHKLVGDSPAAWRRAHIDVGIPADRRCVDGSAPMGAAVSQA